MGLNKLGTEIENELVLDLHNNNEYSVENDKQASLKEEEGEKGQWIESIKDLMESWSLREDHYDVEFQGCC